MKTKIYSPKGMNKLARKMLKDRSVTVIVNNFHGVDWFEQTKLFPNFVLYYNADDFPAKYVVRLFDGDRPSRLITVSDTLDQARKTIPTGTFYKVPRKSTDAPVIVETWL